MTLDGECGVFVRCLIGRAAAADVLSSYRKAHEIGVVNASAPAPLDRALLRVAHIGPTFTQMADSLAALVASGGLLRQKMVLVTAILESRGDTAREIDTAVSGSRSAWVLSVLLSGAASALRAGAALIVVAPWWLRYRIR